MDYYHQPPPFGAEESYGPPMKRQRKEPELPEDEVTDLKEKVFIPVEKYPGYNFVGSLLGPQGSILKGVQKAVNAKMGIYGKGSMKDKKKEEDLYTSEEAEHAHLKEPLHVLIEVNGPRAEAHWRMSNALLEIYKFMSPPDSQRGPMGGPPMQGGGGHFNEGPFDPYDEGGYGQDFNQGGPPMRGGRGRGMPRGGPPRGGGGPPRGRGGPDRGYGRQLPRGGGRGAPPQSNSPASRGAPRGAPRGGRGGTGGGGSGGGVPPATEEYGYTAPETTNYQWDGNYSSNRSSEQQPAMSTSNGFTLKRFNNSYDESY